MAVKSASFNKKTLLRRGFYVSIVVSLLLSMTALWLHTTFYSSDNLANTASEVLREESSRIAISNIVVDKIFEDRPVIGALAAPRLAPVISGLLNTDISANMVNKAVEELRLTIVSSRAVEPVTLNLVPIKSTIASVQSVADRSEADTIINPEEIPDQVTILNFDEIPNYSEQGLVVLWLGPLSFAFMTVGIGVWIYRGRNFALYRRIQIIGVLGLIASIIALLVGPLTGPIVVRNVQDINGQTILNNLYDALLSPFNQQAYVVALVSVLAIILSFALPKAIGHLKAQKS